MAANPNPSKSQLVVVGSVNIDLMLTMPRLPRAGETLLGDQFMTAPGGKGANQAIAAARLGAPVTFIACVGDDIYGTVALDALAADSVDVSHVRVCEKTSTGVAIVLTDSAGENCIALSPGANALLSQANITKAQPAFAQAGLVVCQLESPMAAVKAAIDAARSAGVPVLLNPAPAQPLDDDLLRGLRFLVPNESEAGSLTGIEVVDVRTAELAARALLAKGVQTVLLTMGASGVMLAEGDACVHLPATRVQAVDSTGAGDCFIGAFATAWLRRQSLTESIAYAQRAAAFSVQRRGAQASMPTQADLDTAAR